MQYTLYRILFLIYYTQGIEIPTIKPKTECDLLMDFYEDELNNKKPWAVKMKDATAKDPTSGLYLGNVRDYGSFDECISIKYDNGTVNILGNYCTYGVRILKENPIPIDERYVTRMNLLLEAGREFFNEEEIKDLGLDKALSDYTIESLSICIPSGCKPSEIKRHTDYPLTTYYNDRACQTSDDIGGLDAYDYTTIAILGLFALVVFLCTCYEIYTVQKRTQPYHNILTAASLLTNVKYFKKTQKSENFLPFLEGMRCLSCIFVILAHALTVIAVPTQNMHYFFEFAFNNWIVSVPLVSIYATDSFLFISGLLVSYNYIKKRETGQKFNILYYYFHRIIRLIPTMLMFYLLHISLLRKVNSGPLYPTITQHQHKTCIENWWSFFLFIQNYVNPTELCIQRSWSLSVDMQLFLLSPLLLYPLMRYPKSTITVLWILIAVSVAVPFGIVLRNEIRLLTPKYFSLYYYQTHNRATAWLVGFFTGYTICRYRWKPHWGLNLVLLLTSLLIRIAIMFLNNNFIIDLTDLGVAFFLPLSRLFWAMSLGYTCYSCSKGLGNFFNWWNTMYFWQLMGKCTFAMFFIQGAFVSDYLGKFRTLSYFLVQDLVGITIMFVFIAFIFSLLWVLLIEFPIKSLEKSIFDPYISTMIRTPELDPKKRSV